MDDSTADGGRRRSNFDYCKAAAAIRNDVGKKLGGRLSKCNLDLARVRCGSGTLVACVDVCLGSLSRLYAT